MAKHNPLTASRYEFHSTAGADKGKRYLWSYAQLQDTLLESEGWDTKAVAERVRALKPGESLRGKGGVLTREGPPPAVIRGPRETARRRRKARAEGKAVVGRSNPLPPTVRGFLEVLIAHLTQYDRRVSAAEARKGRANIYRLGLLLQQEEKIATELGDVLDSSDSADLKRLKAQIQRKFIVQDMPPARKTIAAIDEYLQSGKHPAYPGTEKKMKSKTRAANRGRKAKPRRNPKPPKLARNPTDDKGVYVDWQQGKYRDPVEVRIVTDELEIGGDEAVWMFQFSHGGISTPTYIAVIGGNLEDALEEAAEWLAEHAPGYFVDDANLKELHEEALEESGSDEEKAYEIATADLTYTESGYLESWNWYVDELPKGKLRDAILYTASLEQTKSLRKFAETEGYPRKPARTQKRPAARRFNNNVEENPQQIAARLARGQSRR